MRFAIALDLRRLVKPLPASAVLSVFTVDRLTGERLDRRKHPPITEVAILGDGELPAAGFFLIGLHPFPEITRIVAAGRFLGDERLDLAGLVSVVAEDDVTVQVVAAGVGGPFIADKGGEAPRIIRLLRGLDRFAPRRAVRRSARKIQQRFRVGSLREAGNDLNRGLSTFA